MRTEFHTRDAHTAWEFLREALGTDVRLTGEPGHVRVVRGDLGPVRVDEFDYAVGLTFETARERLAERGRGAGRLDRGGRADAGPTGWSAAPWSPSLPASR